VHRQYFTVVCPYASHPGCCRIIEALEKPVQLYSVLSNYATLLYNYIRCWVIMQHYCTPSIIFICIGDHPDTEHPWTHARGALDRAHSAVIGEARRCVPTAMERERADPFDSGCESENERNKVVKEGRIEALEWARERFVERTRRK